MKVTDLMPEIAPNAFEEFWDSWHSTWGANSSLEDTSQTSYAYLKGFVANDSSKEGKQ